MSDLILPSPSFFLVEPDLSQVVARLPGLIGEHHHVRLAAERLRPDKIRGIDPSWVEAIRGLPGVDNIIVVADGARHRALKAPNDKEPPLPQSADVVFVSAGLEVLGKPLDAESAHRPELASAIMGIDLGETITADAIAQLLASPHGGQQGVPAGARTYFLLTGLRQENSDAARSIANRALHMSPTVRGVAYLGAGQVGFIAAEHLFGAHSDPSSHSKGPSN